MSFIYDDPQLMLELLKSGLDFKLRFTKQGQDAYAQQRQNLLSMIDSLKKQLDPNRPPQITWQGADKPTIDDTTLESLGDLVKWLAGNGMAINGKQIVYAKDPPDQKNWVFFRLGTHMEDPTQRDQNPEGFWVNREALGKYVQQLQAYEAANPNPTMRLQLGGIIQEMNRGLGTQLSSQYQAPEKALPDNRVLDNVPDKFVSVESSGYGGNIPLEYKDIKDMYAFNTWLKNKGIQTGKKGPQGDQLSFSGFGNPAFDTCLVLKVLFYRAQHQQPTSKDEQEQSQIYARQISSISHQVPNCDLSGRGEGGSPDMQGGQGGGATSPQQQAKLAADIVDTLPFDIQNIDFDRIKEFFGLVSQLMGNVPAVTNTISQVESIMQSATNLTQNGDTHFSLNMPGASVVNMLKKNPNTGFAAANLPILVSNLHRVLDGTRAVYDYFMQAHGRKLLPEDKQGIAWGQIGARPGSPSVYTKNLDSLEDWGAVK